MSKKLIFYFLLLFISNYLNAMQQEIFEINGTISDNGGRPLTGAAVSVVGTNLGTFSDHNGEFTIKGVPEGNYNLRFSLLGYEPQTVTINLTGSTTINISMSENLINTGEVIINATRAGKNTPMAYSTIGSSELSKNNSGQDLPFLLSLTPSLVETSESGNGIGYTNLRIRGTDASRINVTIDGVPLNDPESQQVFWVDLPDLASSVEDIQVQRGVGTSSNGAGAFGATINIQTKNPENEPFANISSSGGSFRTIKYSAEFGTGILANKFAFEMRMSSLKSDGYIDRTGSDHKSAFISALYKNGRSRLKANIFLGEEHTQIGWWGVPAEMLGLNRRYNPAGEYTDDEGVVQHYENESDNYKQNHFQLFYNLGINNNLFFNTALHYTRGAGYYEEYKEDEPLSDYGRPDIQIGAETISQSDIIRRKWMTNDFYGLIYSLKYINKRLEASVGGAVNGFFGDHFGKIVWMSNAGNTEMNHRWYINSGDKAEISVYGKGSFKVNENLSVFGDLQYRFIDYIMMGSDDDLKDLTQNHKFSFFNPKAGIFYTPSKNQEAFLSFSVAGREPTRSDFKEAAGDPDATPRPETLYDVETGYKLAANKISFSVNLFGMFYKDQLVPTGELSDVGYPIMTNVEKSYRTGIEITAGINPFSFINWNLGGTISRNKILGFTEYYINYNTNDWSEQYTGNYIGLTDIAYSPEFTGMSDLNINFTKTLGLHFISKYVGSQYFDNTMDPVRKLNPYFVNNLRFDFNPDPGKMRSIRLQLLINNLFNVKYESNAYGGNWYEDGIEKSWAYYFPQAGTNFLVRLELGF